MGQRGRRKSRLRCALVDASGLRCQRQVKRAGNTYCSNAHACQARVQLATPVVQPAAKAIHRAHRDKDAERLTTQLRKVADEHGRVSIMAAVPMAMAVSDVRYERGYAAARLEHMGRKHLTAAFYSRSDQ